MSHGVYTTGAVSHGGKDEQRMNSETSAALVIFVAQVVQYLAANAEPADIEQMDEGNIADEIRPVVGHIQSEEQIQRLAGRIKQLLQQKVHQKASLQPKVRQKTATKQALDVISKDVKALDVTKMIVDSSSNPYQGVHQVKQVCILKYLFEDDSVKRTMRLPHRSHRSLKLQEGYMLTFDERGLLTDVHDAEGTALIPDLAAHVIHTAALYPTRGRKVVPKDQIHLYIA